MQKGLCFRVGLVVQLAAGAPLLLAASTVAGQVRTRQSNAEVYQWDLGSNDTRLRPVNSHFCFLNGVHGKFQEPSGLVVHHGTNNASDQPSRPCGDGRAVCSDEGSVWKMGGFGEELGGLAVCVPMADFVMDPGGETKISDIRNTTVSTPIGVSCDVTSRAVPMWPAYAAMAITGFTGGFYGKSSRVEVHQTGSSPWDVPQLEVATSACDVDFFEGDAYSYLVGVEGAERFPNYWAPALEQTRFGPGLEASEDQRKHAELMPTSQGVCYFSGLGGEFVGNGEWAIIQPELINDQEYWSLDVNAVDGHVIAGVTCLKYDQRTIEIIEPD